MIKIIFCLLVSTASFGQTYNLRTIASDPNGTNDTLYIKEGSPDSLWRIVNGSGVFAFKQKTTYFFPFFQIQGKPATLSGHGISDGQTTLISGTNIKTVNGNSLLGSGDIPISGTAAWGSVTGTLANQSDLVAALDGKQATLVSATNIKTVNGVTLLGSGDLASNTSTSNIETSPTASSTTTITHNLGRVPTIIRIYGYGTFTSNAAATATTSSMGIYNSSGNRCVYQRYGAAITTTQAALSSNAFAILLATGGGNYISGVIQNVGATTFDIVWTETGTATAQVYMWECQ